MLSLPRERFFDLIRIWVRRVLAYNLGSFQFIYRFSLSTKRQDPFLLPSPTSTAAYTAGFPWGTGWPRGSLLLLDSSRFQSVMPAHVVTKSSPVFPCFSKVPLPLSLPSSGHRPQVWEWWVLFPHGCRAGSSLEFGSFKLLCIHYSSVILKTSVILSFIWCFLLLMMEQWSFATSCI